MNIKYAELREKFQELIYQINKYKRYPEELNNCISDYNFDKNLNIHYDNWNDKFNELNDKHRILNNTKSVGNL